jgi:hypothetical protein
MSKKTPSPICTKFSYDDKKGEEWRLNGLLHREDGPARIYSNGTKQYYKHGYLHRIDGPAVDANHGYCTKQVYYFEGVIHNENGPAYIEKWSDSELLKYFENDKLHHLQGPAIILRYLNCKIKDDIQYFINGEYYSRENFQKVIKTLHKFIEKLKQKKRNKVTKIIYESTSNCFDICKIISAYCV